MIKRRGPGLKSLGVQQPGILFPFGGSNDQLSRLLSTCQNVQHLRLPIDIEVMGASTREEDEDSMEFVVSRILWPTEATWLTTASHVLRECRSYVQSYSHTIPKCSEPTITTNGCTRQLPNLYILPASCSNILTPVDVVPTWTFWL